MMDERYIRQSFLGERSEEKLSQAKIAVIGLGGGGSHIVQQLSHIGVGDILAIDPDIVEDKNMNRLVGAIYDDVQEKRAKAYIAWRLINGINPDAAANCVQKDWKEVMELLRDRDLIVGCVDSYLERRDLESFSRRFLIPYIDIGMDVHEEGKDYRITGQVILSMPGQPCMKCMGYLTSDKLAEEADNYGAAGGKPQVIWPNGVLASTAIGIVMQLLTPWHSIHPLFIYQEYDGNENSLHASNKLQIIKNMKCTHYNDLEDIGDPFWEWAVGTVS